MIYLNLIGGFGNQLFQYAIARQLSERNGDSIEISLREQYLYYSNREPNLLKMVLNPTVSFSKKKMRWRVNNRNLIARFFRKVDSKRFFEKSLKRGAIAWFEPNLVSVPDLSSFSDVYIGGYFQSEEYFSDILPILRKELLPKEIRPEIRDFAFEIASHDSVCVHVRRGDYIGTDFAVCDKEYYQNAIGIIESKTNAPIYVFSDDLKWCKENLASNNRITFVGAAKSDFEDLFLMKHCNFFVMSNSTFSWWAQELCLSDAPFVIAPKCWHKTKNRPAIYKKNWTLL